MGLGQTSDLTSREHSSQRGPSSGCRPGSEPGNVLLGPVREGDLTCPFYGAA